jgi:hypothetical protein
MKFLKIALLIFFFSFLGNLRSFSQNYPTADELNRQFENLSKSNAAKMKIHPLVLTPGGKQLIVAEIGNETSQTNKKNPAIFIVGNPEGTNPLSAYASLKLANMVLKSDKSLNFTWYILPVLNPDALAGFFTKPLWENPRNAQKFNEDQDDATDEDGPNDLNNDGFITQMRVKDPMGTWLVDEKDTRLMRKADASKGERGIYTLYQEGVDNDNDGEINEDPSGGTNTGINFPHLFKPYTTTGGTWPGSAPEVFALMKFIYSRPEIAATVVFGNTNFCLVPPEGGRRGSVDFNNIRIPDEMVEQLGAEKGKSYTMDEIIELAKPLVPPGIELTPGMVASFLGLGAVVNPLQEDLNWYKELSEQYKEFLKAAKFDTERLEPEKAKDGSFELWAYYHLGVPSFSFNFFTLPKPKEEKKENSGISLEKLEEMTTDEFIALGEEKIQAFLKENNAPDQYKAQTVIGMMKSGQVNPRQLAGMMKNMPKPAKTTEADPFTKALIAFSDKSLAGKGYVNWQPFKHPTLGDVEIGGIVPYCATTPPFEWADSLINLQLPWIFKIAEKLPQLRIADYKVKSLGAGVYNIDVWIENTRFIPFPTAMGKRNENPAPAVLVLDTNGIEFLSGYTRTPIDEVGGNKVVKRSFIIKTDKIKTIKAGLESKSAGNHFIEIKL